MRTFIAVVAAVAATAFLGSSAAAEQDEEPVRLEYHAPAQCDDDAQFFARARSRAPRMRLARPDERARVFVVDIEQRAGRMFGRLTVRNPEGRQTVREIGAKDCTEVADALALVVALAVNPHAAQSAPSGALAESEPNPPAPAPSANSPNSSVPGVPSTAPAPTAPSAAPSPSRPGVSTSAPTPAESDSPSESVTPAREPLWTFRAGLGAWGVGGIAPEPLFGALANAEILNLKASVLAPSYRAGVGYATHTGFVVDGGTAHFSYAGTPIEICPLRIPPGGPLVFRPCGMAEVGFVLARGADAVNPRSEARPWAAIGIGGRLEWSLGRRVGVELDAGCTFPIWRDRFLFGTRSFHRVAWASGAVALGLVMRIP